MKVFGGRFGVGGGGGGGGPISGSQAGRKDRQKSNDRITRGTKIAPGSGERGEVRGGSPETSGWQTKQQGYPQDIKIEKREKGAEIQRTLQGGTRGEDKWSLTQALSGDGPNKRGRNAKELKPKVWRNCRNIADAIKKSRRWGSHRTIVLWCPLCEG